MIVKKSTNHTERKLKTSNFHNAWHTAFYDLLSAKISKNTIKSLQCLQCLQHDKIPHNVFEPPAAIRWDDIKAKLDAKHNVILLANHQTEADPGSLRLHCTFIYKCHF